MANEKRLIDANRLKAIIQEYMEEHRTAYVFIQVMREVCSILDASPAVNAVEVVHGRWIESTNTVYMMSQYTCSECGGKHIAKTWDYCPNCGAKMDGEEKQ